MRKLFGKWLIFYSKRKNNQWQKLWLRSTSIEENTFNQEVLFHKNNARVHMYVVAMTKFNVYLPVTVFFLGSNDNSGGLKKKTNIVSRDIKKK